MNSEHTLNPTGGVLSRRVIEQPASNLRLLERILSNENIDEAWKRVRANKGAPGIDGITVEEFPDAFRDLWPDIRASILTGEYTPTPVLRVEIPKPDGSHRPLEECGFLVGYGCVTGNSGGTSVPKSATSSSLVHPKDRPYSHH